MKNDGRFMTRKEQMRQEYENHFYGTYSTVLDTMLWLKTNVLTRMAAIECKQKS